MKNFVFALIALVIFSACQENDSEQREEILSQELSVTIPEELLSYRAQSNGRSVSTFKDAINSMLATRESNYRVNEIDVFSLADANTVVETVDEQFEGTLTARWVPGDVNRNWNGDGNLDDIDWVSFTPFSVANGVFDAEPIYREMYAKWENDGYCNTVDIDEDIYDFTMGNPSLIIETGLLSTGLPIADISVIGFLPAFIFESVLGSENVLGVAFSFVFIDAQGNPVSTARGKDDKAYTEIWFNDGFTWDIGTENGIDLESVILHEFGHSLNLGHFGILQSFTNEQDSTFSFSYQPVNTMNALYIGEPRNFLGPNDKGNFCESWGSWPWN